MPQLYVVLGMALATLLALYHRTVAEADCHLPEDSEIISLIKTTYTSPVTISLTRKYTVCLASGMCRDKYRSASLLVHYTCTTRSCARGAVVEKELLDLRCTAGAWSVANLTADPHTEFDTVSRTDCSSCVSPTEIDSSLKQSYDAASHCVACPTQCNTGAGRCFGRGEDECCNFFGHSGECLETCDNVGENFTCRGFPCYESNNCTGPEHMVYSGRDCCAKTTSAHSFDNGTCRTCIVHGFECLHIEVNKGFDLRGTFRHNVKGRAEELPKIDGKITIEPVIKNSTTCKFSEIHVRNRTTNFTFLTSCLEIDNKFEMKMKYRSTVTDTFVTQLERVGQFIQDTATVTIVQAAVGQEETFNNVSMDDVQMCVKMKTTYDTCECQSRSCLKKGCDQPLPPMNGSVDNVTTELGGRITFRCNDGFLPSEVMTAVCQTTGWSQDPALLQCLPQDVHIDGGITIGVMHVAAGSAGVLFIATVVVSLILICICVQRSKQKRYKLSSIYDDIRITSETDEGKADVQPGNGSIEHIYSHVNKPVPKPRICVTDNPAYRVGQQKTHLAHRNPCAEEPEYIIATAHR